MHILAVHMLVAVTAHTTILGVRDQLQEGLTIARMTTHTRDFKPAVLFLIWNSQCDQQDINRTITGLLAACHASRLTHVARFHPPRYQDGCLRITACNTLCLLIMINVYINYYYRSASHSQPAYGAVFGIVFARPSHLLRFAPAVSEIRQWSTGLQKLRLPCPKRLQSPDLP